MRIHDRGVYASMLDGIESSRGRLEELRGQISSGVKLKKASQDPAAFRQKSRLEKSLNQLEQDRKLMSQSTSVLRRSDQALENISSNVRQLRSLVMRRASDGSGGQLGDSLANEADRLLESNVNELNTELNGTYLFGGFKSRAKPFEIQKQGGKISQVDYVGDGGYPPVNLPGGEQLKLPLNGRTVAAGGGEDLLALSVEITEAMASDDFEADDFLSRLQTVEENLLARRSETGSADRHIQQLDQSMAEVALVAKQEYTELVGADLPESITELLAVETSLQAAMQTASRTSQLSLVNYLR